jgi:TonB family protein
MKKNILIVFLLFISLFSFSQDTIQLYLDINFMKTLKEIAVINRTAVIQNKHYYITDRYMNGNMISYGEYSSVNPWIEDGFFQYYDEMGKLSSTGSYVNGNMTGKWIYFLKRLQDTIDYRHVEEFLTQGKDSCNERKKYNAPDSLSDEIKNIKTSIQRFISNNLILPARTRDDKEDVELTANFMLDTDGYIKCPSVSNSPKIDYQYEALRLLFLYRNPSKIINPLALSVQVKFTNQPVNEQVFIFVENYATFQGGDVNTFRSYIQRSLVYPVDAAKDRIQGKVILQFCVNSRGYVVDAKILRSIHPLLDNEVIRCLENSPRWQPAKQGGRYVKQQFVIPVSFVLE